MTYGVIHYIYKSFQEFLPLRLLAKSCNLCAGSLRMLVKKLTEADTENLNIVLFCDQTFEEGRRNLSKQDLFPARARISRVTSCTRSKMSCRSVISFIEPN